MTLRLATRLEPNGLATVNAVGSSELPCGRATDPFAVDPVSGPPVGEEAPGDVDADEPQADTSIVRTTRIERWSRRDIRLGPPLCQLAWPSGSPRGGFDVNPDSVGEADQYGRRRSTATTDAPIISTANAANKAASR